MAATSIPASSGLITIAGASVVTDAFGGAEQYGILIMVQQVGAGAGVMLGGGLVDRLGIRRPYVVGALVATAAALASAAVPSLWAILGLRLVVGLAAGVCQAVAVAAVPVLGTPARRTRLYAASSAVWGVAGILVPVTTTAAVHQLGWRGAFVLEAAICLAGLCGFLIGIRGFTVVAPRTGRLDGTGLLLLGLTALSVQAAVGDPTIVVLAAPAAVLMGFLFWRHTGRHRDPVVGRRHLIDGRLVPCHLAGAVAFFATWGVHVTLPLVARDGIGASSELAALTVTAGSLGWLGGSLAVATWLGDVPSRRLLTGALVVQASVLAAGLPVVSSITGLLLVGAVVGVAGGIANNASLALAGSALAAEDTGRALAAFQFLRSAGSGGGSAIGGALVAAAGAVAGLRVGQALAATASVVAVALLRLGKVGETER